MKKKEKETNLDVQLTPVGKDYQSANVAMVIGDISVSKQDIGYYESGYLRSKGYIKLDYYDN